MKIKLKKTAKRKSVIKIQRWKRLMWKSKQELIKKIAKYKCKLKGRKVRKFTGKKEGNW